MSVKYHPDQKKSDAGNAVYELKLNGKSLYVYPENVVAYDGSDPYPCLEFGILEYLDGLLSGEVTQLGGYAESASIKIKNNQERIAQVSDQADFFAKLGKVKIIKLARASDYTVLPDADYTVTIGEERIVICGSYLTVGEDLYAVMEGDFSFFNQSVERRTLSRIPIKLSFCGNRERVLNFKTGILIQQAVFLQTYKAIFIVNVKKFHNKPHFSFKVFFIKYTIPKKPEKCNRKRKKNRDKMAFVTILSQSFQDT